MVRRWLAPNFRSHVQIERPVFGDLGALHVYLIHSVEDSYDRHHFGPPVELGRDGQVASRGEGTRESLAQW